VALRNGEGLANRPDGREARNVIAEDVLNSRPQGKRQAQRAAALAAIELLAERFPTCFVIYENRRKPLKVGIHVDISAVLNGVMTPIELSSALRRYCTAIGYLRSLRIGADRVGLDGATYRHRHRRRSAGRQAETRCPLGA
jgi:sRNA-binding protein